MSLPKQAEQARESDFEMLEEEIERLTELWDTDVESWMTSKLTQMKKHREEHEEAVKEHNYQTFLDWQKDDNKS